MFERLFEILGTSQTYETPMPEADANHAFGALMVRVAKADKAYLFEELERIDQVLAARFNLNPVAAAKFRAECERLDEAMPDTSELGAILAAEVDEEGRESMFRALWDVLMADGLRHQKEETVVAQVADIFGITSERAKALTAE